jgi:hypothetical protein
MPGTPLFPDPGSAAAGYVWVSSGGGWEWEEWTLGLLSETSWFYVDLIFESELLLNVFTSGPDLIPFFKAIEYMLVKFLIVLVIQHPWIKWISFSKNT